MWLKQMWWQMEEICQLKEDVLAQVDFLVVIWPAESLKICFNLKGPKM